MALSWQQAAILAAVLVTLGVACRAATYPRLQTIAPFARESGYVAGLYALLSSRLVWSYAGHYTGIGLPMSNAYVLAAVILLLVLPIGSREGAGVPHDGQVDDRSVGAPDRVAGPGSVGDEAGPLVEPARLGVLGEHP